MTVTGTPGVRAHATWAWTGPDPRYASINLPGQDGGSWSVLGAASSQPFEVPPSGTFDIEVQLDGDQVGRGELRVVADHAVAGHAEGTGTTR